MQSLSKQITTKFERCAGISASRLQLLQQLYLVDEISQSTLQKEMKIDNAAITRHLQQLEASGSVARRINPLDQRVTLVKLTAIGREGIATYKQEKQQFISQLLQDFNAQERHALAGMLQRMLDHVNQL
ncbi:MarR family winged helix-turn-helix transcriptional regulator [Paenibacillus sp. CMAA1364]